MTSDDNGKKRDPGELGYLGLFLLVVLSVGILIGVGSPPGDWYAGLSKPAFNPPNWVFAPVWTVLYVLIAIAGWRTYLGAPRSRRMKTWYLQMGLNWVWSPVFFVLHMTWAAFFVILVMLIAIVTFICLNWRVDKVNAVLFLPYALWAAFAATLNLSLALLN
ncbi:MAG: tryptophan-rich sensory protein [Roseibium sp.]|uniref:TspO/MBR family protein n=1 Tax=Roseibium sp. TaxID=1936156 RepID=UPI001B13D779|nr:TspO/MBR family protein [Roseibium sp.]MBO6890999.1 tryptophan-rich sensory protein [Roseibium sp.]MBO6932083.1 tryptophan-rich sensory protein [Roseibium sp.]